MKKQNKLLLATILLTLIISNVSAFDQELLPICGGDENLLILCVGDANLNVPNIETTRTGSKVKPKETIKLGTLELDKTKTTIYSALTLLSIFLIIIIKKRKNKKKERKNTRYY